MENLNLPKYYFKTKEINNRKYIFDDIRNKFVILQSEEWVRQHFIQYLIHEKQYPKLLLSVEKEMSINKNKFRADVVAYNNQLKPILIVECKAPNVKIEQIVFEQIATYNILHRVEYLVVTNGLHHYCCKINFENKSYEFIKEIPNYGEL